MRVHLVLHLVARRHAVHASISISFLRRASIALDLALGCRQAGAVLHPKPVHLARELVAELLEQILVAAASPAAPSARALRPRRAGWSGGCRNVPWSRAPKHASRFLRDHDESGAADAAFRQTGEQVLRPLRRADVARGLRSRAASASDAPSQPSHRSSGTIRSSGTSFAHPLGRRVQPRHALSGVRILHVAQAIPDQPADVQLVVQDAGSALGVAVDRARTPGATERTATPSRFRCLRDLLRRHAGDELAEDALDDRGFCRFDFALARRHAFRR